MPPSGFSGSGAPGGLSGVRVALLEARMAGEMTGLLGRYGAVTRAVAAVRESPIDCAAPVSALVDRLARPGGHIVVFLTGVGATAVFDEAARQARLPELFDALKNATIVCRGPKPAAVIRRCDLTIDVLVPPPHTSGEVLSALETLPLEGTDVTLVHYGERNAPLAAALVARGAALHDLCVYEWRLPEDLVPLRALVRDILAGQFQAVVFTSQIQGRHLLQVADSMHLQPSLLHALNKDVVVAAMGPVCQGALKALGIAPHVVPVIPKMAPLVSALAGHFSSLS